MRANPGWLVIPFVVATLLASWLGMQGVHEAGHVLAAKLTGGRVSNVVLHPLEISRTELSENPHPVIVCWAGPLLGVITPLVVWLIGAACRWRGTFVLRFFCGFCLVANGLYIGLGWLLTATDASDLVGHGEPIWRMGLFGAVTVPSGFVVWNGLGSRFGLGPDAQPIDGSVAAVTCVALGALVALGIWVGR